MIKTKERFLLKTGIIIFTCSLFLACTDSGSKWKLFTENLDNKDKIYFDKTSIRQQSDNIFSVTTKIVPTQKTKDMLLQSSIKTDPNLAEKYKSLQYSIQENEVNCKEKKHWLKSFADYDDKFQIINSAVRSPDWKDIPPRSLNEQIYQLVCK